MAAFRALCNLVGALHLDNALFFPVKCHFRRERFPTDRIVVAFFYYGLVGCLVWSAEAYWIMKLTHVRLTTKQLSVIMPVVVVVLIGWLWKVKTVLAV